jgi:hypothetical protein
VRRTLPSHASRCRCLTQRIGKAELVEASRVLSSPRPTEALGIAEDELTFSDAHRPAVKSNRLVVQHSEDRSKPPQKASRLIAGMPPKSHLHSGLHSVQPYTAARSITAHYANPLADLNPPVRANSGHNLLPTPSLPSNRRGSRLQLKDALRTLDCADDRVPGLDA